MYEKYVKNIPDGSKKNLILIPLIVALATYLAPTVFQLILTVVFPAPLEQIGSFPAMLSMVITVFLAAFAMTRISKISYRNLGIKRNKWIRKSLIGAAGGIVVLSIVVLLIRIFGASTFKFNSGGIRIVPLLIGLLFFMFQGTWEELIYRAYLMPHFSKVMGNVWSIIITSILFTLGHALNPNMQLLPVINLFIASVVFSLIYYYTGSLFIVGLGHGLWNFSQGFIFGAEVSGNSIAFSIFKSTAIPGKNLISGGGFGFEGGIITTIVGIVMIICFIVMIKRKKSLVK